MHGFEEHPSAFYMTGVGMTALMTLLFNRLMKRFKSLDYDTSKAKRSHYYALKNYQTVLDQVEAKLIINKCDKVTKKEFESVIKSIVPNVQPDEIDLIFKSFDSDKSGTVESSEISDFK